MADESAPDDQSGERTHWLRGLKNLVASEWRIIRGRDPDIDAHEISEFSGPLLAGAIMVVVVGLLPLVGVRLTDDSEATFGPLVGSFALAAVCTTTVAWLIAVVLAGFVVLIVYDASPKAASAVTEQAVRSSFGRIEDATGKVTLLALISGLVSLAIGLPAMSSSDDETSVLEQLLAAQVACLLLVLVLGFTVEAIRTTAEILGSQIKAISWLGALVITLVAFYLAATVGPFEPIALTRNLLDAWLPAEVEGVPRAEVVADLVPSSAGWWSALVIAPFVLITWTITAWRFGELRHLRAEIRQAGRE